MVLIYDKDDSIAAYLIRDELHRRYIPCAVSMTPECIKHAFVFVTFMNTASGMEMYMNIRDPETVVLADQIAIMDDCRRDSELSRLVSRIEDVFYVKYGFDPYTVSSGAVYDSVELSRYADRPCFITPTEKLIVRFLILTRDEFVSPEVLGKFCLKQPSSAGTVAVHINKINRRTYLCSPIKLISSKRLKGYYISRK